MSLEGQGPIARILQGAVKLNANFDLEHRCIRAGLRALAHSGGRTVQPNPITHNEVGNLGTKRPKGLSFAVPHGKLSRPASCEQYTLMLLE